MSVEVKTFVKDTSSLILHCLAPLSPDDMSVPSGAELAQCVHRPLAERMAFNEKNKSKDTFFHSCIAFNIGNDQSFFGEGGHLYPGHCGIIISDGLITNANAEDLGSTKLFKSKAHLVNSVEEIYKKVLWTKIERNTMNWWLFNLNI